MQEPWFWRDRSTAARIFSTALAPLGFIYSKAAKLKTIATKPAQLSTPVICVGNASLGGVGKTPFAISLFKMLWAQDLKSAFISKGYGGSLTGPVAVDPNTHSANNVGDEAMLLSQNGPCWIGKNRSETAARASRHGYDTLIMDDGFQNPTITKTISILLVDNSDPSGNGQIFPGGPMRERLTDAAVRADIIFAVKSTKDDPIHPQINQLKDQHPIRSCWLEPMPSALPARVLAFCGIGNPHRFFKTLGSCDTTVLAEHAFGDHHVFTDMQLQRLENAANKLDATLVTTQKDHVRLPIEFQKTVSVLPVEMVIEDEFAFQSEILSLIKNWTEANQSNETS